jgi:hypothetical protein
MQTGIRKNTLRSAGARDHLGGRGYKYRAPPEHC